MTIKGIKKYGRMSFRYLGRVDGEVVSVVFVDGAVPIEGDIRVYDGTMVSRNMYNFYYVRKYKEVA